MTELREILIRVEAATKAKLHTEPGVWIDKFETDFPFGTRVATVIRIDPIYGHFAGRIIEQAGHTNRTDTVNLTFRAVRLDAVSSVANNELAFTVVNEVRNSALFDPTNLVPGNVVLDPVQTNTFTFDLSARLRRPLK